LANLWVLSLWIKGSQVFFPQDWLSIGGRKPTLEPQTSILLIIGVPIWSSSHYLLTWLWFSFLFGLLLLVLEARLIFPYSFGTSIHQAFLVLGDYLGFLGPFNGGLISLDRKFWIGYSLFWRNYFLSLRAFKHLDLLFIPHSLRNIPI